MLGEFVHSLRGEARQIDFKPADALRNVEKEMIFGLGALGIQLQELTVVLEQKRLQELHLVNSIIASAEQMYNAKQQLKALCFFR